MRFIIDRASSTRDSNGSAPYLFARKILRKDQRKNTLDRRRGAREGVYVTFSFRQERRIYSERRKVE